MFNSILNIHLHTFILLILLIIFSNHGNISANSIYRQGDPLFQRDNLGYISMDGEISPANLWPRTYRPNYSLATPRFDLRRGVIRLIPHKKRTIPLDLQKALYAHGIVGRRR